MGKVNAKRAAHVAASARTQHREPFAPESCSEFTAIELIAAERQHQTEIGYTASHDDEHDAGEIALAGMCYAAYAANLIHPYTQGDGDWRTTPPEWWMWEPEAWRPSDDPLQALVVAGALIAAEIDRLQRVRAKGTQNAEAVPQGE